jgi:flagellar biosynthesis/type III secretory pathway M-ring protein FliF/YscJ
MLFTGLSEKDGGQVIEKLQQLNVPTASARAAT